MTFGRLLPCEECKGGQLVYRLVKILLVLKGVKNQFMYSCSPDVRVQSIKSTINMLSSQCQSDNDCFMKSLRFNQVPPGQTILFLLPPSTYLVSRFLFTMYLNLGLVHP